VPIASALRDVLAEHKAATARTGDDLIFGATPTRPFEPTTIRRRALAAWGWREDRTRSRDDALDPIGLHEARHPFASLAIAAGVNAKALSRTWVTRPFRSHSTATTH
jgi:hypothetical protein